MKTIQLALLLVCGFSLCAEADEPLNLLTDKKFQKSQPGFTGAIQKLIVGSGYECPMITNMYATGGTPYGSKLEIFCGENNNHVNVGQHYAVYPDKLKVNVCSGMEAGSEDCK